ncbi:MAG: BamA/TamA family outer membrane protein [Candidatus Kapabacteria bacterium]|nr:BamA/TamA family outer membrane protein [Candidatus Kapabacteria bacterium]
MGSKKYSISAVLVLIISVFYSDFSALAVENFISPGLYPSRRLQKQFEIHKIRFENNDSFSSNLLKELINTKETNMSPQHRTAEYYYDNVKLIPWTPTILDTSLGVFLKNHNHEISHFNELDVNMDTETLWSYYNTNGFHFAEISYRFEPDSASKINVLTFTINEGTRYTIDTVMYLGLESIDTLTRQRIEAARQVKSNEFFNEEKVLGEIGNIFNILQNSGYYYSKFEILPVSINTETATDSVTAVFTTGKRQKIESIEYIDSLNNQNIVVKEMKRLQMDIKENDWYSRRKVQRSLNNLNSLGTFTSVNIDTSSIFKMQTDTTLSLVVTSDYRKQKEWSVGLFVNNTQIDNLTNIGAEASISHRNWGGAAQSGTFYANVKAKDISSIISGERAEYEGQIGIRLAQPLIWAIENMRIGGASRIYYSYLTVEQLFDISAWFANFRIPISLTNETYINQIIIDFNFELQNLVNYEEVQAKYISGDNIDARIKRSIDFYSQLYHYLQEPDLKLTTANLLGITLIGDSRNHPFNPTNGDYFYGSVDGWNFFLAHPVVSGIARFVRLQTAYSMFEPLSDNTVFATKFRTGVIFRFDTENSYVPFERQFFAGGANSVRGWSSRELHYSQNEPDSFHPKDSSYRNDYLLYSNLIGSRVLLEGSIEFRYTFPFYQSINEVLAEQISKFGITTFLDYGNAYHWFAEGDNDISQISFVEYFTKLAWSAGLGIRYETPIGPIRLDFAMPIYKPNYNLPDYKIWTEYDSIKDLRFHFSIGHAF